ncbi:MAG TPA: hypothetical protein VL981_03945 [Candidatus Methylacidiphilales bacterium]|nr:hypothetical protein [Candidatus Methylacidiphilales bacterium]
MKYIFATFFWTFGALAVSGYLFCAQAAGENQAIAKVLNQKEQAGVNCVHVIIDGGSILSVQMHGLDYLKLIKKIDVSGCPEKFRNAWAAYCAAWEQKEKQESAKEDTLDIISMQKGEIADVPMVCQRVEAYDTDPAWQKCEKIAMDHGVKPPGLPAR